MIITTTPTITGKEVLSYRGVIGAEVIFGGNIFKDDLAAITDLVGGRSSVYEGLFAEAREKALEILREKARQLQASAVIGVRFDFHTIGRMMMVAATGTAVQLKQNAEERALDEKHERENATLYFVKIGNAEKGPFSVTQLRALAADGKVQSGAIARLEGEEIGGTSVATLVA